MILLAALLSGCAERFHGIPVSPVDCRTDKGVHVACSFFLPAVLPKYVDNVSELLLK